ncbi:MAG: carrier protein [Rickettsiaceae bacterium]|jgi:hypothetical protein|nr:carrier protein [Rickettsiaceae bacterium]
MRHDSKEASKTSFVEDYLKIVISFSIPKLGLMLVKHPFYVVQNIKQADPSIPNLEIIKGIYRTNGLKGFYKATPLSVSKIIATELYRGPLMIGVPQYISSHLPEDIAKSNPLISSLVATPIIAAIDSAVLCPFMRMSTHQLTAINNKIKVSDLIKHYAEKNFLKESYRGYGPLFIQNANLWGSFFIIDDLNKTFIKKHYGDNTSAIFFASITGGLIQTALNLVPDTIRTQMQKANSSNLSMIEVSQSFIKTYGVKGLFLGFPHKVFGGIIGYAYKSLLREYWSKNHNKPKPPPPDDSNLTSSAKMDEKKIDETSSQLFNTCEKETALFSSSAALFNEETQNCEREFLGEDKGEPL